MKSETLFEVFCQRGQIAFRRLSPDGSPTPDYEITVGGALMYIEIKELTPNCEEAKVVAEWKAKHGPGEIVTWGDTVGRRVRREIESARQQIKHLAAGKCPGILVLYDARPAPFHGIEPYELLAAMYGCESIDIHLPKEPDEPVAFGTHRFGKGKKFRQDCHTYISAIGTLCERCSDGHIHLDLYDNIHATHRLPFAAIVPRADMTLRTVAPGRGDEHRGWATMVTDEEYKKANQTSDATSEPAPGAGSSSHQG
ncbi:MAG: hypothetical protein PHR35_00330 [Kiritimatiellae bacterium]|nr:hypothetical protein [Kiritimatiellia bacterium]